MLLLHMCYHTTFCGSRSNHLGTCRVQRIWACWAPPLGIREAWVTTREVKCLSRRKQRAYMKAKRSGREQDWKTYKKLKKRCQEECRSAYNTYIAEMIAPDMDSLPRNSGPSLNQSAQTNVACSFKRRRRSYLQRTSS